MSGGGQPMLMFTSAAAAAPAARATATTATRMASERERFMGTFLLDGDPVQKGCHACKHRMRCVTAPRWCQRDARGTDLSREQRTQRREIGVAVAARDEDGIVEAEIREHAQPV